MILGIDPLLNTGVFRLLGHNYVLRQVFQISMNISWSERYCVLSLVLFELAIGQ